MYRQPGQTAPSYGIKCPLSRTYAVFLFHRVVSQIEDFFYLIVGKVVRVPGYDLSEFIEQEQVLQTRLIVAGQEYCLVDLLRCRISYWVEFYSPRGGGPRPPSREAESRGAERAGRADTLGMFCMP